MKYVYIQTFEDEPMYTALNEKYKTDGDVDILGTNYCVFGKRYHRLQPGDTRSYYSFELRSVV